MKKCSKCKEDKELDDFGNNKWTKDRKSNYCKKCMKIVQKNDYEQYKDLYKTRMKLYKRQQIQWYREYKTTLKCSKCGESHPSTLDFHHKNPNEKEFNISNELYNGYDVEKIKKEIEKCIVLCSNCHRKLHWDLEELKYQELLKIDLKR